ncbi:MAG: sigma-70 family RNA polymerase sigma factor [Actinomycetota bacterium]|nr:sigma-70 family RNA polymerase sigma factor [Actinomycetota bacterium]
MSADPAQPSLQDDGGIDAAYAAHGAELYRFALRGLGDDGAAQDVVQETFLRAWRSADRYDSEVASLRVWLFAIARNAMIDRARASAVRPWEANVQDVSAADAANGKVEDPIEQLMRSWMVQEALQRISDQHRTAIVETHLKERPYGEVAAEQGIPIGTLRGRVFYGLKSLKVAMEEMGEIL